MSTSKTATAPDRTTAALTELSRLPQDAFVARLDGIFEHSPWIAERAWSAGPFTSIDALHAAMCLVVDTADPEGLALREQTPHIRHAHRERGFRRGGGTPDDRGGAGGRRAGRSLSQPAPALTPAAACPTWEARGHVPAPVAGSRSGTARQLARGRLPWLGSFLSLLVCSRSSGPSP